MQQVSLPQQQWLIILPHTMVTLACSGLAPYNHYVSIITTAQNKRMSVQGTA
jgi:hypothetical protein